MENQTVIGNHSNQGQSLTSSHGNHISLANHSNTETKFERVDSLLQEEVKDEDEDSGIGIQVIRVKGQKGKQSKKKKLRKSGKERKSPVSVEHIQEEKEEESERGTESLKIDQEIGQQMGSLKLENSTNFFMSKLENEQKLKDILTDISGNSEVLTNGKEHFVEQLEQDDTHNDTVIKDTQDGNDKGNIQNEEMFDLYKSSENQEEVSIQNCQSDSKYENSLPSESCEGNNLDPYTTNDLDWQSASSKSEQGTSIQQKDSQNGDVELTVSVIKSNDSYSSMIDNISNVEKDSTNISSDCDNISVSENNKDGAKKDNLTEELQSVDGLEDSVYSTNQKSFASTLQDMADEIINQPDALLHQHMYEEEPEEVNLEEAEETGLCPGEVE